ncbi:putative deoxyribose-phosphate aldolase [Phaeomoniella chlamydospora]|uniref:Putative deoxyribose-phosphate aldolase n=1 Tax=Phaeomoniella chlamydospora TaxID=158046 RepID=A0A0G2EDK7_PHACM|nr:putative deoxyribose-phosphate aldolase [Phaeomoniella chlamydospora]
MGKKRKLNQSGTTATEEIDTTKPTAVFVPKGGRSSTLSVAIPGSCIANAVSHDQKNHLAGIVARALAVFCVDEVIIFDDEDTSHKSHKSHRQEGDHGYTGYSDPGHFLSHLFAYLETPPYLRKALFPMHPDLKTAGSLPSLDMPHHSKSFPGCPYREGVTIRYDSKPPDIGTRVDIGLNKWALIPDVEIPPKTRVTVQTLSNTSSSTQQVSSDQTFDFSACTAVSPDTPRTTSGYYWGYNIRRSTSLSTVFTECPFPSGYDLSIGTSERGVPLSTLISSPTSPILPYQHLLLVFGGPSGLEYAAKNDPDLRSKGITGSNINELFDYWVNVLPGQGSRTIRTEEAVWLGLMGVREIVVKNE